MTACGSCVATAVPAAIRARVRSATCCATLDGREVEARGEYLGVCTNNVAEYRSLIAGLGAAARHGVRTLVVRMDSELVVRQMLGQYKVKNEGLKPLFAEARKAVTQVGVVRFESVPRDDNGRADGLVNDALDEALRR